MARSAVVWLLFVWVTYAGCRTAGDHRCILFGFAFLLSLQLWRVDEWAMREDQAREIFFASTAELFLTLLVGAAFAGLFWGCRRRRKHG